MSQGGYGRPPDRMDAILDERSDDDVVIRMDEEGQRLARLPAAQFLFRHPNSMDLKTEKENLYWNLN